MASLVLVTERGKNLQLEKRKWEKRRRCTVLKTVSLQVSMIYVIYYDEMNGFLWFVYSVKRYLLHIQFIFSILTLHWNFFTQMQYYTYFTVFIEKKKKKMDFVNSWKEFFTFTANFSITYWTQIAFMKFIS